MTTRDRLQTIEDILGITPYEGRYSIHSYPRARTMTKRKGTLRNDIPLHTLGIGNQIGSFLSQPDRAYLRATTPSTMIAIRADNWQEVQDTYLNGERAFLLDSGRIRIASTQEWLIALRAMFAYTVTTKRRLGLDCFSDLPKLLPIVRYLDMRVMWSLFIRPPDCRCFQVPGRLACQRCVLCMEATLRDVPPGLLPLCTTLSPLVSIIVQDVEQNMLRTFLSELDISLNRLVLHLQATRWEDMDHSGGSVCGACAWHCDTYGPSHRIGRQPWQYVASPGRKFVL